ncbi:MAG: ABC transporter permease [Ilumatobacteraceae bacterium]
MGAVATQVNNELRRHWKASLGFALLIGLVAGTVFATIAGARRTETAYDRYLSEADAEDVMISFLGSNDPAFAESLRAIQALPQVGSIAATAPMFAAPPDIEIRFQDFQAGLDRQYLYGTNKPKLIAGRLPNPERVEEVFINRAAAAALHLEVGDTIDLVTQTAVEYYAAPTEFFERGDTRTFTVTGIGVLPGEVVPMAPFDGAAAVVFTPAYFEAHSDQAADYSYLHIRLTGGAADVAAFRAEFGALLRELGANTVPFIDAGARQAKVNRSIAPQAQALLIFGAMLALVGLLVLGRLLSRHLLLGEGDRRQLWSLGFSRAQLLAVAVLRVLVMLVIAVSIAVVVAVLASRYFPIGPARVAERHPGIAINVAVISIGAVATIVLFIVGAIISVARSLPRFGTAAVGPAPTAASRPSRVAAVLADAGAPATSVVGVRMALERGRGRTAVPVVGALVATALALGALTAAITFGTNLDRLVTTPSLYGLEWDVAVGNGFLNIPIESARPILDESSDVAAWSAGSISELRLAADTTAEQISVPAIGIDTFGSDVYPRMIEGRAVREEDEIVLGQRTAKRLGVDVGDFVVTSDQTGAPLTLEIVGLAVFPGVGRAIFDSTDLDDGATVMAEVLEDPVVTAAKYTTYFVRYHDGVDETAANERLRLAFSEIESDCQFAALCIVTDQKPGGIRNYEEVRSTPLVLAGVLAVLALATLATTLATSVRRRRRDFAVLQSLGFARRQVAVTTAWQATTVAIVALLFGVPLGVIGGRALWTRFSESIGVSVPAIVPTPAIVVLIPSTILLAIAIAFVPGRFAARTNPAQALRAG